MGLRPERLATATFAFDVGILDVEPLALESALEIEDRPVDVLLTRWIDEDPETFVLGHGVVVLRFGIEAESIGEPGTAALLDEQPESGLVRIVSLVFDKREGLLGGVFRHLYRFVVRFDALAHTPVYCGHLNNPDASGNVRSRRVHRFRLPLIGSVRDATMVIFILFVYTSAIMNKHFEDAKYYLKRAGETAKAGVSEELAPVRERVDDLIDREEDEPEPGRFDEVREELKELQEKAEGETREAIADARDRIDTYRNDRTDA